MTVRIECPCGHSVQVPEALRNTRVKCPVCGELLSIEGIARESTASTAAESPVFSSDSDADSASEPTEMPQKPGSGESTAGENFISRLNGSGAFFFLGLPAPAWFTESSMTLTPQRVRLKSSGLLTRRRVDLSLADISSVETRHSPAWLLLLLAILTLAQGIGVIFLIAFLLVRHSYFIVRCSSTSVAIRLKGDDTAASTFGDTILKAVEQANAGNRTR